MAERVREVTLHAPDRFADDVEASYRPAVLRGFANGWRAVREHRLGGDEALVDYLATLDTGRQTELLVGPPEIAGRFFYDDDLTGCNFQKRSTDVRQLLQALLARRGEPQRAALYAGAAPTDAILPDWSAQNGLGLPLPDAKARIWIGNETHVATHFDEASNVAVVVAGRRRFTLFPPEQLENLYLGPLHLTVAGPPVSMVDVDAPDLARYPRFATAWKHALVAELAPGDALYIPPFWWHSVRATGPFNVMVNHWWEKPGSPSPLAALRHAMRAVRDLPPGPRGALRAWFDHLVFDDEAPHAADHLPAHARGLAGPPSPERDRFLEQQDAARPDRVPADG